MTSTDPNLDGKRWIMPAIFEVFGFSSVLKVDDTFDVGKPWYVWCGYAATGIFFLIGGVLWVVFRRRIEELSSWHQLRVIRSELAHALQENKELHTSIYIPKGTGLPPDHSGLYIRATSTVRPSLPAPPVQSAPVKPQHNVQCVGFKAISDDPIFTIAALIFRNVPTGKLLGKFTAPRLRVIYYDNSTGLEIANMCPI